MSNQNQPKPGNKPESKKGADKMDISHPSISEDPEQMDVADREVRPRMANPDRMSPPGGSTKSKT
jgi:hypothetical protein